MITEAFDPCKEAIINPSRDKEGTPAVDACIVTFSWKIEKQVTENFPCEQIGSIHFATGITPVWRIRDGGKSFAFYKTYVGAPAAVATVEDSLSVFRTKRYIVFGGSGCLNREIARGRIIIPTEAYRDEGTSYHYAQASDFIVVRNHPAVEACMQALSLPYVKGKTWTTDSFYRETRSAFERHKAEGCISVEMECAGLQAMCDFRGLELYTFFTSGDLLDAPKWDSRIAPDHPDRGTQHDPRHFEIALKLAEYITQNKL